VQALARDLKIEVVEYPPVIPTRLRPVAFDEIVAHVVSAIHVRLRPGEPIGLLGFSFGGHVAFAAASKLKADGIDLRWLGIVDIGAPDTGLLADNIAISAETGQPKQRRGNPLSRSWTVLTRPRYAFDRLITIGIDNQDYARLAKLWRVLAFFKLRRAQVRFRLRAMRLLRLRSRVKYVFERYAGPVFLFYGSDNKAWSKATLPDDLGWSRWCGAVRTARVPGDHLGMLRSGNLDTLTTMIVVQCEARASSPETATADLGA
jgi:thioesterase domain-containing protein